jgi:hypothetical protein
MPLFLMAAGGLASAAPAGTRNFPVSGFDRIDLSGVAEVAVHPGGGFAVRADGGDAAVDALLIETRGTTLVIRQKPGVHNIQGRARVGVTLPRLLAVETSGAGSMVVDRVAGADFAARLSGAGTLHLPAVAVERLQVRVSGTGAATVAGRAGRIDLDLSGTGQIDARALASGGGRIATSGVGSVHAQANGPVDITASGIGSVTVDGHPACTVHRSGLGSVRCG